MDNSNLYRHHDIWYNMNKKHKGQSNSDSKNLDSIKNTEELVQSSSKVPTKKTNTTPSKIIKNKDVYDLLLQIPVGKVSTYGDLAKALGNPSASRIIGRILGKNPNPIKVPCHRIVMSDGKLGGYMYGISKKRELLENEGISFINGTTVCNFKNVRWPSK
jgi:methylated-DNA-[protein]-cysteine S-methyltransferase